MKQNIKLANLFTFLVLIFSLEDSTAYQSQKEINRIESSSPSEKVAKLDRLISDNISETQGLKNEDKVDLLMTMSPSEYQFINLDSLLAKQGIQRDNYKFSDLQLIDYKSQQSQQEGIKQESQNINGHCTKSNEEICQEKEIDYLSSFQFVENFEKMGQFPNVQNYLKHVQIQQTKIHIFISNANLQFIEKSENDYKSKEFPDYQFKSCIASAYFSKDKAAANEDKSYKFIIFDCDIVQKESSQQIFLIIDTSKVNTIDDIKPSIISTSVQSSENICDKRNLLTMVFTLSNSNSNQEQRDLLIQSCALVDKEQTKSQLYIHEMKINSIGNLIIQPRIQINISDLNNNPLAVGVDVQLTNKMYFFFETDFFSLIEICELRYLIDTYTLEPKMIKKLYGSNFSTVKFLLIFNKNPLERKNYMMYTTSNANNNNLYILDVTKETNMAYVSKKILLPDHIIEQTLVTRDFVVIKGCINQEKQTILICSSIPQVSYTQFIAVFSLKDNRYNVHYYAIYNTTDQIIVESFTDNYVLNNILIINSNTGQIDNFQIKDNYLNIKASDFTTQAIKILKFTLISSNLIQKMPDTKSERQIVITFAQIKQSLKLTDEGNQLFGNKPIQKDDLQFVVDLDNRIMGPQIEYLLIKESHDSQKYNVTINNYLSYDLNLDLSGIYQNLPYYVSLTHVTNANFNQIQIFTQFNTTKGYDTLFHYCTLNKEKQNLPCQKQELILNYPYFVGSFHLYQTSMYIGLISKEKEYNFNNQILIAFYMNGKKFKVEEIPFDQISSIEVIDQKYIGILRSNLKQIMVIGLNINQELEEKEKGFFEQENKLGWSVIAQVNIDFEFKEILKLSMKLLTTRSIIFIHTDDNIIRVQGIYWKKGYSNSQFRFGMNSVSQLNLSESEKCNFTVFTYPIVIIVCVNDYGDSSIKEYVLSQDKTLILTRTYNTFQYKINLELYKQSFTDKVFFYQRGYYLNVDQRTKINTLLVFDPLEQSTNTLKSAANIQNKSINVPYDIDSTYGSYMLYDNSVNSTVILSFFIFTIFI